MDLSTSLGFSNALFHTLNLDIGSGKMTAPVCSTFVIMRLNAFNITLFLHGSFGLSIPPWFAITPAKCFTTVSGLLRSMGSTLRTRGNHLGRQDSPAVQMGNLLCSRAIVLLVLCACKGIFWCLEQPSSSTMEFHPLFQSFLRLTTVRRLMIRMSQFGAPTPKRTLLYASYLHPLGEKFSGSKLGVSVVF